MLTRLKVTGFKNLMDVDILFSPFTCIAGANGVGKSNLFDAIQFLSALSDRPLIDAARSVRDEGGRTTDVRSLFHRVGNNHDPEMSFEVDMIIPKTGIDDLGQEAEGSSTFLRYSLVLAFRDDQNSVRFSGSIEILREELIHLQKKNLKTDLSFKYSAKWLESIFKLQSRVSAFISTEGEVDDPDRKIRLHQDSGTGGKQRGGTGGKPRRFLAKKLPRTVLSEVNATESPTALLVRREMQSWRVLQLEPSSLRKPDDFISETVMGIDGSHLPATLYKLVGGFRNQSDVEIMESVYSQVANSLSALVSDVISISVDRDEKRQLLTLVVKGKDGTSHPAKALSDGTLRFLALAILNLDYESQGLVCLEEPENGIHPERIPAILELLQNIATDVNQPIGIDNPLRQVIINTHSPAVVQQVPEDSLLVAELKEMMQGDRRYKGVRFSCLPNTWRTDKSSHQNIISMGKLLSYLNPVIHGEIETGDDHIISANLNSNTHEKVKKVIEREDIRQLKLF